MRRAVRVCPAERNRQAGVGSGRGPGGQARAPGAAGGIVIGSPSMLSVLVPLAFQSFDRTVQVLGRLSGAGQGQ